MIKLESYAFVLVAALIVSDPASAGEPLSKLPFAVKCWPDCVGTFCCDDYQRKPLPCAPLKPCFECPDYCCKPLPCVGRVKAFCCDDYCAKPLPPLCNRSGKGFTCIPQRLPPVGDKTAATQPAGDRAAAGNIRRTARPISSSRRTGQYR